MSLMFEWSQQQARRRNDNGLRPGQWTWRGLEECSISRYTVTWPKGTNAPLAILIIASGNVRECGPLLAVRSHSLHQANTNAPPFTNTAWQIFTALLCMWHCSALSRTAVPGLWNRFDSFWFFSSSPILLIVKSMSNFYLKWFESVSLFITILIFISQDGH